MAKMFGEVEIQGYEYDGNLPPWALFLIFAVIALIAIAAIYMLIIVSKKNKRFHGK